MAERMGLFFAIRVGNAKQTEEHEEEETCRQENAEEDTGVALEIGEPGGDS